MRTILTTAGARSVDSHSKVVTVDSTLVLAICRLCGQRASLLPPSLLRTSAQSRCDTPPKPRGGVGLPSPFVPPEYWKFRREISTRSRLLAGSGGCHPPGPAAGGQHAYSCHDLLTERGQFVCSVSISRVEHSLAEVTFNQGDLVTERGSVGIEVR